VLAVDAQHHAAGDEHGERRTHVEKVAHEGGSRGHLFEVVDEQQRAPHAGQLVRDHRQQRALTRFAQPERRRNRRGDQRRLGNRGEIDECDATLERGGEVGGRLDGEPGLARAARSGERHEADGRVEQRARNCRRFLGAPQKRRSRRQRLPRAWKAPAAKQKRPIVVSEAHRHGDQFAFHVCRGRALGGRLCQHAEHQPLEPRG
jgi:hypothetical protein